MAVYLTEVVTDLAMPPQQRPIPHQFAMGDNNAYTITALLCDSRNPEAELLDGTVGGELVRPDGVTVALAGEKGDAVRQVNLAAGGLCNATPCSVTLPQACFAVPGRVTLTIKLTDGTTITQALSVSAVVVRTSTDEAVDPGEVIPDLAAIQAAASEAAEAAEDATAAAADARAAASSAVRYDTAQSLTDAQKTTARENIGAASEAVIAPIVSVGKNLLNPNTLAANAYIKETTGVLTPYNNWSASDYIEVTPGTQYSFIFYSASQGRYVAPTNSNSYYAIYDANKGYISGGKKATISVTEANAKYIRISGPTSNYTSSPMFMTSADASGISAETDYIPYTKDAQPFADCVHEMHAEMHPPMPVTTVLGRSLPEDLTKYGVTAAYAAAMKSAIDQWSADYAGDATKVPFILHTDQHGRLNAANKGVFDLLAYLVNWDNVSAIMNLGDTVVDHWVDDATNADPLLRNGTLEDAMGCLAAIRADKQINVFGNHDTWYTGSVATAVTGTLPSLKYLNPYFRATGLRTVRCPDNSGLMEVYDDVNMIRYLVVADWDYGRRATLSKNYYYVSKDHWQWIIDRLTANTGYDIVVVSHVPLILGTPNAYNPITGTSQQISTVERFITQDPAYDNIWTNRKNNGTGTITAEGVTVSYDFSGCTDRLLCAFSGHWHDDVIDYCKGDTGVLCATFDWFANRTIHFGLIDRANEQIKVWKLHNESDTPGVQYWTAPFVMPNA